ncbi:MAG TPA: hypothetical protein VG206_18825 [Terriglobia bacterium]|nr:hypothetical protein [Terriglobia bacterium]
MERLRNGAVRIRFCTADEDFGQLVGRALGEGFEVSVEKALDRVHETEDAYDGVLLDLRRDAQSIDLQLGLGLIHKVRRIDFPPPIIAVLGDDDPVLGHKLIEAGAYDTVSSRRTHWSFGFCCDALIAFAKSKKSCAG